MKYLMRLFRRKKYMREWKKMWQMSVKKKQENIRLNSVNSKVMWLVKSIEHLRHQKCCVCMCVYAYIGDTSKKTYEKMT